ncbi:4-carboxymuconolactone decarboxylase [Kitasatospora sp. MAA4]|uniref:carboxymuconolactone decarboxylase family protein n=1 Tax=Kitasatospora sp. MAA4 TaxID=3035093 RepID=UPI0024737DBC|nr:carboxymuconolactone decarboxylase family protein [Kitasatospora sp. MAA4]MDH6133532.1 4-carboxymuconolactone decarboxylase [Kitasatospora sp. MAA4]
MTTALSTATLDREAGYRLLDLLQDRETQDAALPGLEAIAPGFADWMVTSLFGGTYQREGLELRDRQLVNLAVLATLGGVDPQLTGHIRSSLRVGLTEQQIVEVFVHLAPYIGTPKALAALRVAAATFAGLHA